MSPIIGWDPSYAHQRCVRRRRGGIWERTREGRRCKYRYKREKKSEEGAKEDSEAKNQRGKQTKDERAKA